MGPLLGKYFCDSSDSCPSLCQATDPAPRSTLGCASVCSPLPKGVWPTGGVANAEGQPGLGQGGSARVAPGAALEHSGMDMLLLVPPHPSGGPAHPQSQSLGLGGHHALILSSESREVGGQGAGFLSLLQPTHPPSIGAGKQGQGPWKSKPR